jgi:hypothetical protein
MKAFPRTLALALVLLAAPLAAGCASAASPERANKAAADGMFFHRTLKSYHVVQSAHRGPVGFLKVYEVQEAGGAVSAWKAIEDPEHKELGIVNSFGKAWQWEEYPPGAMPNPREPYRLREMPVDSIERNAMRMLGIDPATDEVTFPVAQAGDIR